jgi:hypothetical protein
MLAYNKAPWIVSTVNEINVYLCDSVYLHHGSQTLLYDQYHKLMHYFVLNTKIWFTYSVPNSGGKSSTDLLSIMMIGTCYVLKI